MNFQDWFLAIRPKTLMASWIPVVVGTALAYKITNRFEFYIFVCTALSSLFIQISTNLLNDAIDFKKGTDTHERLGPKRMTQSGKASYATIMKAGGASLAVAILLGIPLVIKGGSPILLLGITSAFLAYSYTGGPVPLAYMGLGEIFVYLFFGLAAVMGTFYLQAETFSYSSFIAGSQIGLLAIVILAINNYRDYKQDVKSGKNTLAVRFGKNFSKFEILFSIALAYFLGFYWASYEMQKALFLPLLSLPLAVFIIVKIYTAEPSTEFNKFLALSGVLHMIFGLLLSLGIYLS